MLGRYALYDKIASGGMASVHIGRLIGPVGFARTVAIKRMHPQYAEDPEFVSMFLDEAMVAARIRHPNVVPTLDVVSMAGELFLVMDYVHGESFSRLIRVAAQRGERLPASLVASVMVGVLHGLHAAHEAKSDQGTPLEIVHRDVSPHNVLVGIDGSARVLDFGVAKALGRVQTTREGQLKGKLAYMSPEQARGQATRTTDVYAAAVVMWEALTSKRLFTGENEAQVLTAVLTGCKIPPSRYAPEVSPEVDAIVLKGLALNSADRFQTARDMARAVEDAMPLMPASQIGEWVESAAHEALDERSLRIAAIESNSSVRSQPHGFDDVLDRESHPPPSRSRSSLDSDSAVRPQPLGGRPEYRSAPPSGLSHPSAMHAPAMLTSIPVEHDDIPVESPGLAALSARISRPSLPERLVTPIPPPQPGVAWRVAAGIAGAFVAVGLGAAIFLHSQGTPASPAAASASSEAPSVPASASDPAGEPPSASASAAASAQPAPSATAPGSGAAPVPTWRWMPGPAHHAATGGSPATQPSPVPGPSPAPQPAAPAPAPAAHASCDPPWTIDSRGVRVFKKECL